MIEVKKNINKKWYIIRTSSNREKSIAERIKNESMNGELMGRVSNVLIPIEYVYYMKNGKKVKREKIMFPSYIFVECNDVGTLKDYLKGVNGSLGFLSNRAGEIEPLSEKEINRMLGIQEEILKKDEVVPFVVDEEVMIADGPFSSMKGTIDEINDEKVKLSVSIFGRRTPLELNINQINKIV